MRVGIFGATDDAQSLVMSATLERLGCETLLVESNALDRGLPVAFDDGRTFYRGECVDDVLGFYLRSVPAPYVPAFAKDAQLLLYADWFTQYMQTRERASFFVSWLLHLQRKGAAL